MAVSYAAKVYANDKLFFLKLICRWTGSVWKLLWVDFVAYFAIYISVTCLYRLYLLDHKESRIRFETIAKWISLIRSGVPLSFLLGFFVTYVLGRWWSIAMTIPWLYSPAFFIQALIQGGERYGDLARKMRLTILRYMNMAWILVFGDISMEVKDRFNFKKRSTPFGGEVSKDYLLTWRERLDLINKDTKVKKYFGTLITKAEIETFSCAAELSSDDDYTYCPEYWLPLMWATRLLHKAHQISCIRDDRHLMRLMEMLANFRGSLGTLWLHTEYSIPLVYTQVATIAVYIYLLSGLFSSQISENNVIDSVETADNSTTLLVNDFKKSPLLYIPLVGMFEFVFYLGWFKIGMCLMNPLGEDEEDLPLSDILNLNLKISVKCGGAENSLFPSGLAEYGSPEDQIIEVLGTFDFSQVRAHDKFESPEETEARIKAEMLRKQKKSYGRLFVSDGNQRLSDQTSSDSKAKGKTSRGKVSIRDKAKMGAAAKKKTNFSKNTPKNSNQGPLSNLINPGLSKSATLDVFPDESTPLKNSTEHLPHKFSFSRFFGRDIRTCRKRTVLPSRSFANDSTITRSGSMNDLPLLGAAAAEEAEMPSFKAVQDDSAVPAATINLMEIPDVVILRERPSRPRDVQTSSTSSISTQQKDDEDI